MVRALVLDIGTTSIRAAVVGVDGSVSHVHQRALSVTSPQPGEVELDGVEIGNFALELARAVIAEAGPCDVVGITNQRATTVVFDATTNLPVGPVLGWQDLRTVIDCLVLQGSGLRLAPNQSATKATWLMKQTTVPRENLRFATIETYVAWLLSEGRVFVTDHSNAAVTGLVDLSATAWDPAVSELLEIPSSMLPAIVATMGEVGLASALPGSPVIAALIGDQPASLFGQSCLSPGQAKITFGTGAMLDAVTGEAGPDRMTRFSSGCFPIVANSHAGTLTWGAEAIMLSAGTCIEWLREDLGLISSAAESETLARSVEGTDGVSFVPALMGLGTPQWDFGARGAFFGLTRGSTRAHLVRAVLDGIAQRAVDLIDAAVRQVNNPLDVIRVDGGMTQNSYLMQRLADFSGRSIEISKELEATTKGAGLMALIAVGALSRDDVATMWEPRAVCSPTTTAQERQALRSQWLDVVSRAEKSIPELSSVTF